MFALRFLTRPFRLNRQPRNRLGARRKKSIILMLTEYDARTVIVKSTASFREQLLDGTLRFNDNHRCIMVSRKSSLFGYHYFGPQCFERGVHVTRGNSGNRSYTWFYTNSGHGVFLTIRGRTVLNDDRWPAHTHTLLTEKKFRVFSSYGKM